MKRVRILFAIVLLSFALPIWRFADYFAIFSPFDRPFSIILTLSFLFFILIPIKLILEKTRAILLVLALGIWGFLAFYVNTLSSMATNDSSFNHCGQLTWTGMFYPLRGLMPDAHKDDIEARNQMCWVRKMIQRVPERFDNHAELSQYVSITTDKLLSPIQKFRASLPLVTILHLTIFSRYTPTQVNSNEEHKLFIAEGIKFWQNQYTEMISERVYPLTSFPHSKWIQLEYGLIEKNWNYFIDHLTIEE